MNKIEKFPFRLTYPFCSMFTVFLLFYSPLVYAWLMFSSSFEVIRSYWGQNKAWSFGYQPYTTRANGIIVL
jgi:hypothetical protein